MENLLFCSFSFLTVICGVSVITSKNPIHSVLFLVLVFFNVASLLIFLGVEFLALLFLIVYVGAVAVLFLFIIMMLSVKIPEFKGVIYQYMPIGILLNACFLCEVLIAFDTELTSLIFFPYDNLSFNLFSLNPITVWNLEVNPIQNVKVIANVLYTYYALLFILAGVILLISMVGAIMLTLHRRSDIKRQEIYKQVQQEFDVALCWKK
uniref:NADH-ubiquinone oxidoreductase chain 6 n=1 Tax=Chroomonas placoidea TaxID=173977 RepID=A0A2P1G829_9CRYP|nr:NADH dehydrogenase subunit 6 [Chroomonas placoidea]AVM81099.1 NADH dehydrogenase subunit 6 [Chroomonas placoidea]